MQGLGHGEAGEESWVHKRAPAGPLVHEPVSLKACLCLASLLEAHLLIPTKEKNGVGNMWMSSPPCLGSHVPRTQYSAWGRKQGEQVLKVLREAAKKTRVFSVLRGETNTPNQACHYYSYPFKASKGCHIPGPPRQGE